MIGARFGPTLGLRSVAISIAIESFIANPPTQALVS
jgi:hypothetical protein